MCIRDRCVAVCPRRAIQIAGTPMKASDVAARIQRNAPILKMNEGGVTFSGGEALMQHEFVEDVCDRLPDVHKAIETSGYASEEAFLSVVNRLDLVSMDIKLVDSAAHKMCIRDRWRAPRPAKGPCPRPDAQTPWQ